MYYLWKTFTWGLSSAHFSSVSYAPWRILFIAIGSHKLISYKKDLLSCKTKLVTNCQMLSMNGWTFKLLFIFFVDHFIFITCKMHYIGLTSFYGLSHATRLTFSQYFWMHNFLSFQCRVWLLMIIAWKR